jgi:two-component system chemotaxis sensor kinase CheA
MSTLDDAEIIAAARAGFLDEAIDMLHQFEAALLVMESTPEDADNLNAAFRAAHTIKGTAGLFGCDAVVSFTHEVETLLEGLRSGQLQVSEPIAAALLQGRDQMQALIDEVRTGDADPAVAARSVALGAELRALHGVGAVAVAAPVAVIGPAASGREAAGAWHLSLRFGADALRNGLDPLAFLRYLGQVGQVQSCHTLADAIPALERLDPEACCLGFEIRLHTERPRSDIEDVFEFALDDCSVRILPPDAAGPAFVELLADRCADDEDARAELLSVWMAQGVSMDAPAAGTLRRRSARRPRLRRPHPSPERRQAGTDRRSGGRDRRGPEETRFVKVRADKLDHLIDLIGELVIAGSGAQMVANLEGSSAFLEATQRVSDLVQATRDGALALRMVPVGETFSRFQRVVRDTSKQLGKEIELVVTGG